MQSIGWILLSAATCLGAEEAPTAVASKTAPPAKVGAAVAKTLGPDCYNVVQNGKQVASYWIRAEVPVASTDGVVGYNQMQEGTFVGVVEIKGGDLTDFRDQKLKPGIYTMRLGIQPQDGNHMGVAPSPEFLCLVPAELDAKLDPMAHDDLMKISKKASGTGHPAVLFLQPFTDKPNFTSPTVNANAEGNSVLNISTKAVSGDKKVEFPIGIIIIGVTTAA
jgi:hypothetical protein